VDRGAPPTPTNHTKKENAVRTRVSRVAGMIGMATGLVIIGGSVLGGIALASAPDDAAGPAPSASTGIQPTDDGHRQPSLTGQDDDAHSGPGHPNPSPGMSTGDKHEDDGSRSCDTDHDTDHEEDHEDEIRVVSDASARRDDCVRRAAAEVQSRQ
jgi:hypothetical protein